MKFGSVENPESIDFTLPQDHPDTLKVLRAKGGDGFDVRVGCAKWNKQDLKNFYPRGTKDELQYYSTQFNSIELNATFYQAYSPGQIEKWVEKTPEDFKFFPKINQGISHLRRLNNVSAMTEDFCNSISHLQGKLGMVFLQVHDNFKPKDFDRLEQFVTDFPKGMPLAVELRNTEWFNNKEDAERVYQLFEKNNVANIIVDTAGRRDLLHMRLTSPVAFIRYVGANHHPTDYTRLDPWIERISQWKKEGLKELNFFMHQNEELESPKLCAYFIEKINPLFNLDLTVPLILEDSGKEKKVKKETIK
ncbi:MAG TPA: DUF72 domain-containing protein [Cytophagales bacterium]|nr:DUF72 domain-containing protein [Cytophagales bacterium]